MLAQETIIRPLEILTEGVSWVLRCSVSVVVGFGVVGFLAGPRFLLCLLAEMTVACVERGHTCLFLVLPPASLGPRRVQSRGLWRASAREEVAERSRFVLSSSRCVRTAGDESAVT